MLSTSSALSFVPFAILSHFELAWFWKRHAATEPWPMSDFSPVNLHGYAGLRHTECCQIEDLLWLRIEGVLFPPMGDWVGRDWQEALAPFSGEQVHRVPESLLGKWEAAGCVRDADFDPDHSEYLYRIGDLQALSGIAITASGIW